MKFIETIMTPFLMAWVFAIFLLAASFSHANEITGYWVAKNPAGDKVLLYLGVGNDFFIEDETSWVQGTYTIQDESLPRQLDLHIEDASNIDEVGKGSHYIYDIQDNSLAFSETDNPPAFDAENPSAHYVYIGINLDSSDDDDDEKDSNFSLYASCFINGLASFPGKVFMGTD